MYVPGPPYHETINNLLYGILEYFRENPVPMNLPRPPFYNVTNDLLYAILDSLNNKPQVIYSQFRVLYVSARYGNDSTAQANNQSLPFKTITAAKNNAFSNDVIHVMEGIYDEANLAGAYNYWFDFGAQISYSGSAAIFNQMYGVCMVRGYGRFSCTGTGMVIDAGNWLYCFLDIECETIEAMNNLAIRLYQNNFIGAGLYKPHKIKARRIYSATAAAIEFRFDSYGEIEADDIVSDSYNETDAKGAIFVGTSLKGVIKNSRITSNNDSTIYFGQTAADFQFINCEVNCNFDSPDVHAFHIANTLWDLTLSSVRISCLGSDSKSIYAANNLNLHIGNGVTANRDTGGAGTITYVNKGTKLYIASSSPTIDITGKTDLDLSSCQNSDFVVLYSTNAQENISQILNAPHHHTFRIAPYPGLTLTVKGSNPTGADQNSIILETPQLVLKGQTGDWLELVNGWIGAGNRQVNASNYNDNG